MTTPRKGGPRKGNPPSSEWYATPQAKRGRPHISHTVAPETVKNIAWRANLWGVKKGPAIDRAFAELRALYEARAREGREG